MVASVPKSESCSTSALALSVRLPSAEKSRLRRDTGRSRLMPATPRVRPRSVSVTTPSRRRRESWSDRSAPSLSVALASPAGKANRGPVAVPRILALVRVVSDLSVMPPSRSVKVSPRDHSALPVVDQRQRPTSPFKARPARAARLLLSRSSGSTESRSRPMPERPSLYSSSPLAVAETLPRIVRLTMALPRSSRRWPTRLR